MSIIRNGNVYVPTCDYCGTELSTIASWNGARTTMKEAGWKSILTEAGREEICDDCQELG